jgi:hypothetical protein
MNGYIQVQMNFDGGPLVCWQKVVDGIVVDYVDSAGVSVSVPELREEHCVTGELLEQPV